MAYCLHNVDECPATQPSPPSSIRIGNWVLIECNGDGRRKKRNNKSKLKHKEGTCWHSIDSTLQQATVSVLDDFGPNIHSSPFVFLLFDSRLCSVLSLLFFVGCLRHGFAFQWKLLLLPTVLSVSNSFASFLFFFHLIKFLQVGQHHWRSKNKTTGEYKEGRRGHVQ